MIGSSSVLTAFNNHFFEFIDDIQRVFPEDVDIMTAKNSMIALRKINPKIIIKSWDLCVVGKYKSVIESGDIRFFSENDYSSDLSQNPNSKKIMDAIDRLREPVKMMNLDDQAKIVKYIQNLTKLSEIYKN